MFSSGGMVPIPDAARVLRTQQRRAVHSVDTTIRVTGSPVTRPPAARTSQAQRPHAFRSGAHVWRTLRSLPPEDTAGGRLRRVLHTWAPDVFTRRDGGVSTARGRGAGKRAKGNSGGRVQRGYQGWGRVPVCSVYVPGYWAGAGSKSVSWASEDGSVPLNGENRGRGGW